MIETQRISIFNNQAWLPVRWDAGAKDLGMVTVMMITISI